MEELVGKGLVKHIGSCNIGTSMLRDCWNYAKIKPAVLQIEMNPYCVQKKLLRLCKDKGMAVTAYSSLGAGSYIELGMATQQDSCLEEPIVKQLSDKYKKSLAQIVLRWAVQRGTAIIPKSVKEERIIENISLFDFALTEDEMSGISDLDRNKRYNDPGNYAEPAFKCFFPIFD